MPVGLKLHGKMQSSVMMQVMLTSEDGMEVRKSEDRCVFSDSGLNKVTSED